MVISREKIIETIKKLCVVNMTKRENIRTFIMQLKNLFNIPFGMSLDILMLKEDLYDKSDFVLFAFLYVLNDSHVEGFFTSEEIRRYYNETYEEEIIKFPLVFNMVQISDDQWIGKISVKRLMELRDAQLIYYNENTQRTMQRVFKGNVEYYKIKINKSAVEGIEESMKNDTYIPNTITLNMPETTFYDFQDNKLTIKAIDRFDILDGYHRYIAMSKLYNLDGTFDYSMELRIVSFSEGKAKHFVWQEDQKTKMRKTDSDSFNQYSEANKIVQRLNTDSTFVLAGKISRNKNIINSAEMGAIINALWFGSKQISKTEALKRSIQVKKDIQDGIEKIIEDDVSLIDKPWKFKYLACVLVCVYSKVPYVELKQTIDRIYNNSDKNIVNSYRINRKALMRLQKMI